MDTSTLMVGKTVRIDGGFGPIEGKIVQISLPCIHVETSSGQFRFNSDGKECGPNGSAYMYEFNPMHGPGPWEIVL